MTIHIASMANQAYYISDWPTVMYLITANHS